MANPAGLQSYEDDAYIEEEYSEEVYDDDTTVDSIEALKEAVYNAADSDVEPVYDYSDITDSEEEEVLEEATRKPHPTSHHMDVTIRKQFDTNSGQSSRISCLLLIIVLTVHWMFVRFSLSRRHRPRRVIQIRRRPAHLH